MTSILYWFSRKKKNEFHCAISTMGCVSSIIPYTFLHTCDQRFIFFIDKQFVSWEVYWLPLLAHVRNAIFFVFDEISTLIQDKMKSHYGYSIVPFVDCVFFSFRRIFLLMKSLFFSVFNAETFSSNQWLFILNSRELHQLFHTQHSINHMMASDGYSIIILSLF